MSSESDEDYASADEATNTSSGGGQCELQESQEPQSHSDVSASASNVEQPEVVKVVDNKYVSDAESVKNGGLVELSEEQRKELKEQAGELKNKGNDLYKTGEYEEAIELYSEALQVYPSDCDNERAVCHANRAACYVKMDKHEESISDCSEALKMKPDYMKALLRRAQSYEATEKLEEALADYKKVIEMDPSNQTAREAIMRLPKQIEEQREKLKEEMLGKLKDLGNMFLKPFGISTDNFQMQQDPNTGSYSVNFKR
ncbi:tetratricopeptide repeat protein 1-like [Dysidea avara]|uniref:tetratricopeptide repeat protein 1-like n=1 Tax=Dysidea avara TaxID=196820 RepID=UPI003325DEC1